MAKNEDISEKRKTAVWWGQFLTDVPLYKRQEGSYLGCLAWSMNEIKFVVDVQRKRRIYFTFHSAVTATPALSPTYPRLAMHSVALSLFPS